MYNARYENCTVFRRRVGGIPKFVISSGTIDRTQSWEKTFLSFLPELNDHNDGYYNERDYVRNTCEIICVT